MGYCYEAYGSRRLVCDKCGHAGGVRKRKCPYKVLSNSLRSRRIWMHYCYPPALCQACYAELGGLRGVHGQECREGAAASQAADDAIEAKLDAGDMSPLAAWGDGQPGVAAGMVGVLYGGRDCQAYYLLPKAAYQTRPWFSEVDHIAESWENHPGLTTKEVHV
jgi:hypothetical protein